MLSVLLKSLFDGLGFSGGRGHEAGEEFVKEDWKARVNLQQNRNLNIMKRNTRDWGSKWECEKTSENSFLHTGMKSTH